MRTPKHDLYALVLALMSCGVAWSQEPEPLDFGSTPTEFGPSLPGLEDEPLARASLKSNRNFPDFIGFLTNPLQAIDPRALTQMWPVFLGSWWNPNGSLPGGNAQVYGAGINLAVTERFSVGLNQGGYATITYDPVTVRRPGLQRRIDDVRGSRGGWVNLGGFAQYTLVEDVPGQFLFTAGTRIEVPTGASTVYQGHGQPVLSPYLTAGKGWGNFHVLNTTGYAFSLGRDSDPTNAFYGNLHFDYKVRWLYPLLEFNWAAFTKTLSTDLPLDRGLVNFGTYNATGSYLTISPGVNTVLVQDRLELGAAYTTRLASQRDVNLNGVTVKMILRY